MTRILVVDDQHVSRVAVGLMLRQAGYHVALAGGGEEGLRQARARGPDVIVLDVNMPDLDGFAVVAQLKRDPETAPIPVILLTAEAPTEELVVRGLELGAYDFLAKGCSRAELLARVGVMSRIKRSHDELAALARITDVLVQATEPRELAQRFAEQVCRSFQAAAALLVLPGTAEQPDVRAGVGVAVDEPRFFLLVDALFENVQPEPGGGATVLPDATALTAPAGPAFASALVACVERVAQRPLLLAVFAEEPAAFNPEADAPLLGLLARHAVLALENALLQVQTWRQAQTLQEQAVRLESAMRERSRFFATMNHELRTPINAILGYSELLRDGIYGPLQPRQHGATERVLASAQQLLSLVNDVLDFSKIDAGKLEIVPEPADLALLLREVAAVVELQATSKGLSFAVQAPPHCRLVTDAARVRQIVLNLVTNAIKFTDRGGVELALHEAPDAVEIRVRDSGPGIAAADQERVFADFEQTEVGAGRGGTGLGLAISRRLAALLGGSLSLHSTPGEGSTFTLRLPR